MDPVTEQPTEQQPASAGTTTEKPIIAELQKPIGDETFSVDLKEAHAEAVAAAIHEETGAKTEVVAGIPVVDVPFKGLGTRVDELESAVDKIAADSTAARIEQPGLEARVTELESMVAMILRRLQHHGVTSE